MVALLRFFVRPTHSMAHHLAWIAPVVASSSATSLCSSVGFRAHLRLRTKHNAVLVWVLQTQQWPAVGRLYRTHAFCSWSRDRLPVILAQLIACTCLAHAQVRYFTQSNLIAGNFGGTFCTSLHCLSRHAFFTLVVAVDTPAFDHACYGV
ncbi:hypothetical protein COO60DRAFT_778023 [Scenedesmus sp. NREL 46B-D3]|nr:hypothetical protein COO60DRAFT_778023 [Scenedesmus sp. NREL 46B-D3]